MDGVQGCLTIMKKNKPYLVMIFVQFITAGMLLLSKAALTKGMNPYVFVIYRQALAALALAPLAVFLERSKKYPPLSWPLLGQMFVVSIGITMALNLFYLSLNYVSPTLAIAISNLNPTITFILAVCFRMESLSIKQRHGMAKVIGSTLSLVGALLCTFVRGPPMYPESQKDILHLNKQIYSKSDWIKGSSIVLASNLAWCSWWVMQDNARRSSLTRHGMLIWTSTVYTWLLTHFHVYTVDVHVSIPVPCQRTPASIVLKLTNFGTYWHTFVAGEIGVPKLLVGGVVAAAVNYSLQVWVVERKGPVFAAVFQPLALVITAIFSALLFQETLHWGSVSGAILLVLGLYAILWAKSKEEKTDASDLEAEIEGNFEEDQVQNKEKDGPRTY